MLGTIDAIIHELKESALNRVIVRIIGTGVGTISSNDVQSVSATENAIIVGFNVKPDRSAIDLAERLGVPLRRLILSINFPNGLRKLSKREHQKKRRRK